MNTVLIVAAVAVAVVFVIGRQLQGEALRGKRVVLLPAVLTLVALISLAGMRQLGTADIACIALGALIAAVIGVGQGAVMRLESRDGGLWGQLPTRGLWLWGALIGSRLAFVAVAVPLGAHAVWSSDSLLFVLGVNRLAQAAVIASRAVAAGIPFAAERDGKTFPPGLFGLAELSNSPTGSPTPRMPSSPLGSKPSRLADARAGAKRSEVARLLLDRFAARS
jgi:hypothetical protein